MANISPLLKIITIADLHYLPSHFSLCFLTPGGSIVKLKKIAQFLLLRGSVRSLEMAFRVVNASLTAIVRLAGLCAS